MTQSELYDMIYCGGVTRVTRNVILRGQWVHWGGERSSVDMGGADEFVGAHRHRARAYLALKPLSERWAGRKYVK